MYIRYCRSVCSYEVGKQKKNSPSYIPQHNASNCAKETVEIMMCFEATEDVGSFFRWVAWYSQATRRARDRRTEAHRMIASSKCWMGWVFSRSRQKGICGSGYIFGCIPLPLRVKQTFTTLYMFVYPVQGGLRDAPKILVYRICLQYAKPWGMWYLDVYILPGLHGSGAWCKMAWQDGERCDLWYCYFIYSTNLIQSGQVFKKRLQHVFFVSAGTAIKQISTFNFNAKSSQMSNSCSFIFQLLI